MSAAQHNNNTGIPRGRCNSDDLPTPSEVVSVVLEWLKKYWDTPRQKSRWTEIAGVVLNVVIAAAAIYSAWIFQGQLSEARRATLVGQRAAVFMARTIYDSGKDAKTGDKSWGFTPQMENGGNSVALDVRNYVSQNSPEYTNLPEHFDYADKQYAEGPFPNSNLKGGPAIMGPHETLNMTVLGVREDILRRVNKGDAHVALWGWISYRDIFGCVHKTEFCEEVVAMSDPDRDGKRGFIFNNCTRHNCVDNTCEDYEETHTPMCELASEPK